MPCVLGECRSCQSEDADGFARPMTSFAWVFWQELVQMASMT